MAAILCRGINNVCSGIGQCFGNTCKIICTGPCKICAKSCEVVCKGIGQVCNSPMCAVVTVTLIGQVPPAVIGLTEVTGIINCQGSIWLLISSILSIINICAALYLSIRIQNKDDEKLSHLDKSFTRASYLLCNDPWMAAYIIIFIIFVIWLCLGSAWNWSGVTEKGDSCSDTVSDRVTMSIAFGWFFIIFGSIALSISMCWAACFDKRDYAGSDNIDNARPTSGTYIAGSNNNTTQFSSSGGGGRNDIENQPGASVPQYQACTGLPQQNQQHFNSSVNTQTAPSSFVVEVDQGDDIPFAQAEAVPTAPVENQANNNTKGGSTTKTSSLSSSSSGGGGASNLGSTVGEVVGQSFTSVKNFVSSKMNKK